jgi:quercetin dioxygenase-like cupin family protein
MNAYSVTPDQFRLWIDAARTARVVCGVSASRPPRNLDEKESLFALRRGVFARRELKDGESIQQEDIYYAFPPDDGQITANDWSKYTSFTAMSCIKKDAPLTPTNTLCQNVRLLLSEAVEKVKRVLNESRITIPGGVELELSHHYGLERFEEFGLTMITVVNRAYCKKLLICLPEQVHPEQYHKEKEETFHVLYGEIEVSLDGIEEIFREGDVINIEPGVRHKFKSRSGAVIEEISSTHFKHDSFYSDEAINRNPNRKTYLTYWMN